MGPDRFDRGVCAGSRWDAGTSRPGAALCTSGKSVTCLLVCMWGFVGLEDGEAWVVLGIVFRADPEGVACGGADSSQAAEFSVVVDLEE